MAAEATAPTVCPTLRYKDAKAAVAFLKEAFGFTEVAVYEDENGVVEHAELAYGNGVVMLGSERSGTAFSRIASDLGAASVYVAVQDTDAHHERAVAAGAEVVLPLTDQDYGSRDYTARDPEGNLWSFGTYVPRIPE
ncbi:VOC family protein [Actinacidiphila glaucinigra]|uniref:VOC family protein n=1 Tax=Actinacidiphila glaucinigra TaxID=235986 RepID=UPI0029A5E4D8|nr:VOC family protein [Actinacidiphila glaucinigra]MDX2850254.1 VOC family protein [Streptomyces sp. PA03-3a]